MAPSLFPGVLEGENGYELEIDSGAYSLDAIKKALYRVAAHSVGLITQTKGRVRVSFAFSEGTSAQTARAALRQFCVCLGDEDLRESIARQTAARRDILLAHAFSRADLAPGKGGDPCAASNR